MKKPRKPSMSESNYLRTHLRGMDKVKKRWYMNAMKTWKKEDYQNYTKFHLWMMGEYGGVKEEDIRCAYTQSTIGLRRNVFLLI
jgi:hypothetical protein